MQIAPALLAWAERHGRHDLPWQLEPTPYRVWVSEIMLQQTQVSTVLGYYARFMQRLPSVGHLAAAPIDEVLHLWSGLGYYARARHLHLAAQQVVRDYGGQLPSDAEQLMRLPGIGRSTAAAIVALAHGRRATILDGNVKRVMARLFAVDGPSGAAATEQALWECAERCTPQEQVRAYTQAIMDLGATVCTRSRPLCARCPLSSHCIAYRCGRTLELPRPRLRAPRPVRRAVLLLAQRVDGAVLLSRRASRGVWAGLWTPPEFLDLEQARQFAAGALLGAAVEAVPWPPLRHRFTHFDFELIPLRVRCQGLRPAVADQAPTLWYDARTHAPIGLPAPITRLLRAIDSERAPMLAAAER
jgi:A/G-specific adenine glycosylase